MNKSGRPIIGYINQTHERQKNLWRNNVILMVALVIMIFLMPLFPDKSGLYIRLVLGTVVLSGVFAAEYSRKVFGILFFMGIVVMIAMALGFIFPDARSIVALGFVLVTFSLTLSTIALVSHVAGAETVDRSTIACSINSYLLMGLTASVLFIIIDILLPNSFLELNSSSDELGSYIYFGFVTLTTLGYGDITPIGGLARSFSTFIALAGQLYLVIIMALIIGKYLNSKNR